MSAILGGEGLAIMDVERGEQGNGATPPAFLPEYATGRRLTKMPIKTRVVHLDGDYAGFSATIRTNAPFGLFMALGELQGDGDDKASVKAFGELVRLLPQLVLSWDVCDEEGQPIPCTSEGMRLVPGELLMALVGKLSDGSAAPK